MFFWACTDFSAYVLLYVFGFMLIAIVATYFGLKEEFLSVKKLSYFADALKVDNWSYRINDMKSPWLLDIASAFNTAAERFERKQNELRQVIDLVPGFIYAKDADGKITLANKSFAAFLGMIPQEIVGRHVDEFDSVSFLKKSPFENDDNGDDLLKSISEEDCEKDGNRFVYLVFRSPLLGADGMRLAHLVFAYDITGMKEIQNNLQTLNISLESRVKEEVEKNIEKDKELIKAKEKFIRNAVHEINTALTVITLNAEYLIKDYGTNRSTSAILGGAKSLSSAYGDLSYFTLKDSTTFQKERLIDLSELIIARIEFFRDIAGLSDITIASQIKPEALLVLNEAKITRLIDNNLSNAIKYSHPQKTIFIRFTPDDDENWILEFESIGKKIDDKSKIFELYTREDGIKGGHGVGLSMVREICDDHGICIELDTDGNRNVFRYRFSKNC